MRRGALGLVLAGLALGLAAQWSLYLPDSPGRAAADFAVGAAFVVGGALTLRRSTATGALMAATGLTWFLGSFAGALVFLHRGPLVHLLLSYPNGRLNSWASRAVVVFGYLTALLQPLGRSSLVTLALAAAVLAVSLFEWVRSTGLERRARSTALAGTVAIVTVLATAALTRLADASADTALLWVYEVVLVLVAAGLAADLRWGRWTTAAITGLVLDLGQLERESLLSARLARSVGDPSLEVGYWAEDRGEYVDELGAPVKLQVPGTARAVLYVPGATGEPAAAILHDRAVLADPRLAEAATAAVRIAAENAELQERVLGRVTELRDSRRRLVEAADAERRRLAEELQDATEPRLRALEGLLEGSGPEGEEWMRELATLRGELRELALGLHPRSVTESGLGAALAELAKRFPFTVEVRARDERLPAAVAAAAYFVSSEALANAAKHARPTRVRVLVQRLGGTLLLEVADDGVGGADPLGGSGLRGLADRVEALGGAFRVDSVVGAGTRINAELPLASEAASAEPLPAGSVA